MKKKTLYIGAAVVIVVGGLIYGLSSGKPESIKLETAKISRGNVNNIITASGALEAVETVEVGTQVSGVIQKIYVDYNSQVKRGQLLAQLDETPLRAQLDQSKASVDQAEAQVKYQKATYDRYKTLIEKKLIAQTDFDLQEYNYNNAVAALKQARSNYDRNKINLEYATITSPIDGIILKRSVDEGQTVAASFNTPTMFIIANDLTQMQVEANVDEADIGKVFEGQRVNFTVDAYPELVFDGTVTQIRMQPVETSTVITYTVVVTAPNPDKKLMPGMTASVSFYPEEKDKTLILPARALNVSIDQNEIMIYAKSNPEIMIEGVTLKANSDKERLVWVKNGNTISQKKVVVGNTDEANYELLSGLKEGDEVLTTFETEKPEVKKSIFAPPGGPGSR
jgi:HlyD family secretion protein